MRLFRRPPSEETPVCRQGQYVETTPDD